MRHKKCDGCGERCCGLCCTKIENFSVSAGSVKILEDVNIHIHCGELTAIIGPNGAGKSTLLRAILGEMKHTGELKYLDFKGIHNNNPLIGYVPQQLTFDKDTPSSVLDLFMACASNRPIWLMSSRKFKSKVETALSKVNAASLIDKKLGSLSGGELQRVMLALALDPVPDLLLLDEPVSGIDQKGLELFYATVSELRTNFDLSIILVSHDLDMVSEYADNVILLNKTVLCSGTPEEVFSNPCTLEVLGKLTKH